ncbi:MAG: hypothetical protein BWY43_00071 [candidate division WS2 bacterium ADurb.Bin280]|uniref:Uncharacterized protein n=1 Tax=candidate division WS2 bacterium ADurb.Bin280 TaxID=1852829 RepID=A0A1V5SFI5_9BACT|nr:MAG: hypothetical protein BWY43_00071 [candidate division WS2 bacterium ADurb.Bin280]
MKKIGSFLLILCFALVVGGCQNSNSTDDAESALISDDLSQEAVNTPPVPPEPTRPAN